MKKLIKLTTFIMCSCLLLLWGCANQPSPVGDVGYIETGVDADHWVKIPQGSFLSGQHDTHSDITHDYEIMLTDVTNAQYANYLNEALSTGKLQLISETVTGYYPGDTFHRHHHEVEIKAGDWPYFQLDGALVRIQYSGGGFAPFPAYKNHPVTMVTWFGAWGYCQYYGWRLPSDLEWEKAARGTDNRPYPWGQDINPLHANYLSSHDLYERIFKSAGGTTPVGFYNGQTYLDFSTWDGRSPYGLYDMAGNVWQWTGTIQKGTHYRNLRGGSHSNYAYNLRIWTHNNADPSHASPSVGFRCARDN
ncbi:MAG: SUMF1/EgtB/PvdO family nonheme iron enzyme [Anaerolineae bacterium]|nr:SUMF1/EgtB/PvdO family nonheme iron enzyme [Anaerolineae bacterium]